MNTLVYRTLGLTTSSDARRCLHPPQLPSTAPPGHGLADEWDATTADNGQALNGPQPRAVWHETCHLTQERL